MQGITERVGGELLRPGACQGAAQVPKHWARSWAEIRPGSPLRLPPSVFEFLSRRVSNTMTEITLRIKPTTGSPPFEVKTTREATVGDLKTEVAKSCDSPADLVRLIYKGQVLKDHATVESYGETGAFVRRSSEKKGGKVLPHRLSTEPFSDPAQVWSTTMWCTW